MLVRAASLDSYHSAEARWTGFDDFNLIHPIWGSRSGCTPSLTRSSELWSRGGQEGGRRRGEPNTKASNTCGCGTSPLSTSSTPRGQDHGCRAGAPRRVEAPSTTGCPKDGATSSTAKNRPPVGSLAVDSIVRYGPGSVVLSDATVSARTGRPESRGRGSTPRPRGVGAGLGASRASSRKGGSRGRRPGSS
jgi:hypothetical protein